MFRFQRDSSKAPKKDLKGVQNRQEAYLAFLKVYRIRLQFPFFLKALLNKKERGKCFLFFLALGRFFSVIILDSYLPVPPQMSGLCE